MCRKLISQHGAAVNSTDSDLGIVLHFYNVTRYRLQEIEGGNLVERVSILSQNENKSNITRLLNEILNKNSTQNLNETTTSMSYPLKQARENFEKNYLLNQLRKNKGNISKTAEFIGMERSALHRKLKSLGIKGIN